MAYTKKNSRVARFQCDPVYSADGGLASVPMQAFLQARIVNDDNPEDAVAANPVKVDFDLLAPEIKDLTITASGKTVTYQELGALLRKACLDRANAAGVS